MLHDLLEQGQIQHLVSSSSLQVRRVLVSQRNLSEHRNQISSTASNREEEG